MGQNLTDPVTTANQMLQGMTPELAQATLGAAARASSEAVLAAARTRYAAWLLAFSLCALSAVAAAWLLIFFNIPWPFVVAWVLLLVLLVLRAPAGNVSR